MSVEPKISAQDALARLKDGNKKFLTAKSPIGDVSPKIREKTAREGQFPYAVIVTCSDSRVVPFFSWHWRTFHNSRGWIRRKRN